MIHCVTFGVTIITDYCDVWHQEVKWGHYITYWSWSMPISSTSMSKDVTQSWISLQMCMGMCLRQDVNEESKRAKLQSSKIEQDLCEHARTEMNVVKILMLGRCIHGEATFLFSC